MLRSFSDGVFDRWALSLLQHLFLVLALCSFAFHISIYFLQTIGQIKSNLKVSRNVTLVVLNVNMILISLLNSRLLGQSCFLIGKNFKIFSETVYCFCFVLIKCKWFIERNQCSFSRSVKKYYWYAKMP